MGFASRVGRIELAIAACLEDELSANHATSDQNGNVTHRTYRRRLYTPIIRISHKQPARRGVGLPLDPYDQYARDPFLLVSMNPCTQEQMRHTPSQLDWTQGRAHVLVEG